MFAVAPARSSEPPLPRRRSGTATRKVTRAESTTERMTPSRLAAGAWSSTAMIEPGAAGARRPESRTRLVATPVMPPAIIARMRRGFMRT